MVDMEDMWIVMLASVGHNQATVDQLRARVEALVLHAEWRRLTRTRHYLTAACLKTPEESPWMHLYRNGSDINFLNATSFTRPTFHRLLSQFKPFFSIPPPTRRGGRPRKVRHHHIVLGLVLVFYVSSMEQASLSFIFGLPPATVSELLGLAEIALRRALRAYPPARISWPSPSRQRELAQLVHAWEPLLPNTFGFIDGKNFQVQEPSNADLQNAMYNGWLHSVYVTGTICFVADGTIVWCRHNCPGSWNDSETSAQFRAKLLDPVLCPDRRLGVVSDSAFPCSKEMVGRILTPLKEGNLDRLRPSVRGVATILNNAITSVRQAAEWGMGSVDKVYRRLKLPLPYNTTQRGIRLDNIFRLSNVRVLLKVSRYSCHQ